MRVEYRVFRAVLGLAILLGLIKLYGPLATSRGQQDELARLRLEKATLVAEQRRLQDYKQKLASDEGFEAVARKLGFVRDGERRLVFIPKREKKASSPAPGDKKAGKRAGSVPGSGTPRQRAPRPRQ